MDPIFALHPNVFSPETSFDTKYLTAVSPMRLSSVDNWNFRFHSPATVRREEGKGLEMKNSFHRQLLCPISPHDDSSQTIKFVIMERAGKMKRFSCFENSFTEISFARLVYDRKSFLRGQLFIYVSAFHSTSFLWKFSRISRHLQGRNYVIVT